MPDWDILVLDKSGSMFKNKQDLVDGFNNLVTEQKEEKSANFLTVITFNDVVEVFKEETFPNVSKIENSDIITKGTTALLDAVGEVYDMILNNDKYKKITLTVITDGQENSSRNYTIETLNEKKKLIDEKYTLNMVFIGADISCVTENEVNTHASQSVDCSGDIQEALRIASRSMSSGRDSSQYIPEGIVYSNPVTPLVMKRSFSSTNERPPKVKRCKTLCDN
tara:strand:- start:2510 stop:3178 length:669 start_codon:yes stop_codon:yes gene_type:complete